MVAVRTKMIQIASRAYMPEAQFRSLCDMARRLGYEAGYRDRLQGLAGGVLKPHQP